jgi:hypothetical protein
MLASSSSVHILHAFQAFSSAAERPPLHRGDAFFGG